MDLKSPGNLDPKLKEAYERIMGNTNVQPQQPVSTQPTQAPQSIPQAPVQNQPEQPSLTISPQPPAQEIPLQPQPPLMETHPIENLQPFSTQLNPIEQDITSSPLLKGGSFFDPTILPQSQNMADGSSPVKSKKKKHGLMAFFLGIGLVLFFVIYAVVWTKVFGLF